MACVRSPCTFCKPILLAERHFARGVTALKKLAVPEARLLDYQDCKGRVEKMAAENRGADRLEAMRRWVEASKDSLPSFLAWVLVFSSLVVWVW
jgi:hypothetical protein